jgi:hypothetical protein
MSVYVRLLAVMDTVLQGHAHALHRALRFQRRRLKVSMVYLCLVRTTRIWDCAVFVAIMAIARPAHVLLLLLRDVLSTISIPFSLLIEGVVEFTLYLLYLGTVDFSLSRRMKRVILNEIRYDDQISAR